MIPTCFLMLTSQSRRLPKPGKPKQARGYGLALLLVFIASTVLIGTSLSLTLSPSIANTLGSASMDGSKAKQVALVGLNAAQEDIKSKLAASTTVTTSYRLPSSGTTSVTMPVSPGSGSTASVGNYYVTVTKARGITYMLKVTATVGNTVYTQNKLVQIDDSQGIPLPPLIAFALRKLLKTYSGSAVKLRCTSTSTTPDVGFTTTGDFDLTTLRSCLGDSTLPLDYSGTNAAAAYSLRRLRSGYTGSAIRVRSTASGSPEQDIGFDSNGNLDTKALMSFVGANSGYVKTWYDQSTNGKNVTQSTNSKQPRIVNAGVPEMINNAPTIRFINASSTTLTTASVPLSAGSSAYTYVVVFQSANLGTDSTIVEQNSATSQAGKRGSLSIIYPGIYYRFTGEGADATAIAMPTDQLLQSTMKMNTGQNVTLYQNGNGGSSSTAAGTLSLSNACFSIASKCSNATEFLDGYISEVIVYPAALGDTQRVYLQKNEGHYFNVASMVDGYVSTWYDQSGNARDATQATTTKQPTIAATGQLAPDGTLRPSVLFDGASDYLATASSSAWPSGNANRSMNAIFETNTLSIFAAIAGWGTASTGTNSYLFFDVNRPGPGFWGFNADAGSSASVDTYYGHRVNAIKSGSNTSVYIDGALNNTSTPTLNTPSSSILTLGANTSFNNLLSGTIAEAIIYTNALSAAERVQLESSQTRYYGQ
jgi:hypothetical protein